VRTFVIPHKRNSGDENEILRKIDYIDILIIHIDFVGPLDNHYFTIVIDVFSKWPEVFRMREATSTGTVSVLHTLLPPLTG